LTTSSQDCPEGLSESEYYDFYAAFVSEDSNTTEPVVESESESDFDEIFETNVVLISEGFTCDSEGE
jgi:hypothetical protein